MTKTNILYRVHQKKSFLNVIILKMQEEYDVLGYSLVCLATTMSAVGIVLTKLLANKVGEHDDDDENTLRWRRR